MFKRYLNPSKSSSFFLFGARGVGKTTLLKQRFSLNEALQVNLLNSMVLRQLSRNPTTLRELIAAFEKKAPSASEIWTIIDEVQRIPELLDTVHDLLESNPRLRFVLTGSSARKLKRAGTNLLAGRAFVYHLYPLTHIELGTEFDLAETLLWGTLPKILSFESTIDRENFLSSYVDTYLKEEVAAEQLVRKLQPFHQLLHIAAQLNGEPLNYTAIGRDLGIDSNTVRTYYEILEDTLVTHRIPGYQSSLRKQFLQAPKVYLFDLGVCRALGDFAVKSLPVGSSHYGRAFEHFLILEIIRLNHYLQKRFKFSYLRTADGFEIDLVISAPGGAETFVEIKSSTQLNPSKTNKFVAFMQQTRQSRGIILSQEPLARELSDNVQALPWQLGLQEIFGPLGI